MKESFIDLSILDKEKDQEYTFETIMSSVEFISIHLGGIDIQKEKIEKLVMQIERKVQDLNDSDNDNSIIIASKSVEALNILIPVLKEDVSNNELEQVVMFLTTLTNLIDAAIGKSKKEILLLFKYLSTKLIKMQLELNNKKKKQTPYTIYFNVLKNAIELSNKYFEISPKYFIHDPDIALIKRKLIQKSEAIDTEWILEVKIVNKNDSKSIYLLWLLLESLNKINGVKTELEEIKKGSIWAKIKVVFGTNEANINATEFLNDTREIVKGRLAKNYKEKKEIEIETEKIELKKLLLTQMIEKNQATDIKRRKELELLEYELEIEKKRLENEKLSLEVFMKKKNALSELLAEEIITTEEFELLLNNQQYLLKKGVDIITGGTIKYNEQKK